MDTLVQKAWEFSQQTARFSLDTILTATVWLEEQHRKTPCSEIAMVIALHYLILALRRDLGMKSTTIDEYCTRAERWQDTARARSELPLPGESTKKK